MSNKEVIKEIAAEVVKSLSDELSPMVKRYFLIQYVLGRSKSHSGQLSGDGAAQEAIKAWGVLEKEFNKAVPSSGKPNINHSEGN